MVNVQLERIFSHAYRDRRGLILPNEDDKDDDPPLPTRLDDGLIKRNDLDTTLLVHLFGKRGKRELTYDEFSKFMEK